MATSRSNLARLPHTPHLDLIVPRLPPVVLHRLVQYVGVESAADILALARPAQIARLIDEDVWRSRGGESEALDVERFGVWLRTLVDAGTTVAADALARIDFNLTAAAFAGHVAVFDYAAVSPYLSLDGEWRRGRDADAARTLEAGGYRVEARALLAWDAIVELLAFLHDDRPDYFHQLMRQCVRLSNSGAEEDGFHTLLQDDEQHLAGVVDARQQRREGEGFVGAAPARAFLAGARRLDVHGPPPRRDAVAEAYFRELAPAAGDAPADVDAAPCEVAPDARQAIESAVAAFIEGLAEAGVLDPQLRALPGSGDAGQGGEFTGAVEGHGSSDRLVMSHVAAHDAATAELAYLANVLLAGCTLRGRAFSPRDASAAAAAICNLGLEQWPRGWPDQDLVTAFQVGWRVLQDDVSLPAARHLHTALGTFTCRDRMLQLRIAHLRTQLGRAIGDAAPWRVRDALDALLPVDAAAWAGLVALLDECPVLHAAVGDPHAARAIEVDDVRFFSSGADVSLARAFVRNLPARLAVS